MKNYLLFSEKFLFEIKIQIDENEYMDVKG